MLCGGLQAVSPAAVKAKQQADSSQPECTKTVRGFSVTRPKLRLLRGSSRPARFKMLPCRIRSRCTSLQLGLCGWAGFKVTTQRCVNNLQGLHGRPSGDYNVVIFVAPGIKGLFFCSEVWLIHTSVASTWTNEVAQLIKAQGSKFITCDSPCESLMTPKEQPISR